MKKKILIIGGTSDLANTFIERNYQEFDILITYNNNKENAELLKNKYNIEIIKLDINSDEDLNNLYSYLENNNISIDILINSSCLCLDDDYKLKTREEFRKVIDTNLIGPFFVIQKLIPLINEDIINMLSTDGINTYNPYSIDYCAAKAGLLNITKNLSLVLDKRIIGLAPNYIDTKSVREMDPIFLKKEMERIGQNKLIKKETVSDKIIEIINNKEIKSGTIIRMD